MGKVIRVSFGGEVRGDIGFCFCVRFFYLEWVMLVCYECWVVLFVVTIV